MTAPGEDDLARMLTPAARAQTREELIDDCARPGPLHDRYISWMASRGRATMPTRYVEWLEQTNAPLWQTRFNSILGQLLDGIAGKDQP